MSVTLDRLFRDVVDVPGWFISSDLPQVPGREPVHQRSQGVGDLQIPAAGVRTSRLIWSKKEKEVIIICQE